MNTDRAESVTNSVKLSLEGDRIPWEAFASVSKNLHSILRSLDKELAGEETLEWVITKMSASSAEVEVAPTTTDPDAKNISSKVIETYVDGLSFIDGNAERPDFFTDSMLKKVKNVSNRIDGRIEGITLEGSADGTVESARVTQRVAANVDEVVGGRYTALGSVEGRLEVISIHRGIHANIYDRLTGKKIQCICDLDLLEELTDHIGNRLLVEGEVRYNKYGEPTSIDAKGYRVIRPREELPQPDQMVGLTEDNKLVRSDNIRTYMRGGNGE